VHWCCITAHLYEEQISTGVNAMSQACCEPVMQSSTEQWESLFALALAAMNWCYINANLYEEQISLGVFAVTQGCCQPGDLGFTLNPVI